MLWSGNTSTELISLGGPSTFSMATDINNSGQIVGISQINEFDTLTKAVIWSGGGITQLNALNGAGWSSTATGINNAGLVVGYSMSNTGDFHATLWNEQTPIDLGSTSGFSSGANDGNYVGQIVGRSLISTSIGIDHATLWDNGQVIDLNDLLDAESVADGWVLQDAIAINDNGWIVGRASQFGIGNRAFLLVPNQIPEPASMALVVAGLAGLASARRRKIVAEDAAGTGVAARR